MKTIDLAETTLNVVDLISLAKQEPLLILTMDGDEFLLAEADDFDREVKALRASQSFQRFLDQRSASQPRFSLDAIEQEIEQELASHQRMNGA